MYLGHRRLNCSSNVISYIYMKNKKPKSIVRVTKMEFETGDGVVYPMPRELEVVPTIKEFQTIYDEWFRVFHFFGGLKPGL